MKAPDEIETARLILRRPVMSDAAAIFASYASDPEVTHFLGWPRHESVRDTEALPRFSGAQGARCPAAPYLVRLPTDRELSGGPGLGFQVRDAAVPDYVLARDAWGQGY